MSATTEELRCVISDLLSQGAEQNKYIAELEAENKALRERISLLEAENADYVKACKQFESTVEAKEAEIKALREQVGKVKESTDSPQLWKLYYELLYGVATAFPNESRHETALRYILEREKSNNGSAHSAQEQDNGKV